MSDRLEKTFEVQGVQDGDNGRSGHTKTRLLVPIRVLYTINASPQFLLARQKRKVEVVPVVLGTENMTMASSPGHPDTTIGRYRYARIPLKICLGAVCTSSPELLADRSRDYSVYVLDPLESTSTGDNHAPSKSESLPIQSHTSDNTSSSYLLREGISIGMGLMSWCMADDRVPAPEVDDDDDDNDGCVTGKLIMDRGVNALEIVIYLRETALQSQQQHALSLSSLGFYPSSTASPTDYSSQGNAQCMLSVPSSPGINVSSSLPESSQISITGCDLSGERASECGEPLMLETASSSTSGHPPRVGRPPGSTTNPEKRARRLAIQSHKEMLERMENIAKMQQGREYDKTLIRISDHDIPTVTDEDIARQRKILQELESRPLIVDKSRLLTTKPLPKRPKGSISIVPLSKGSLPKQTVRTEPTTNATASGSRQNSNDAVSKKKSSNVSTTSVVENKHETQLLLSLLTSVLGKVDGPSINQSNSMASQKGKGKETGDDALADVLKQLLPIIPNAAIQASAASASRATPSPANTAPVSVPLLGPKVDQWNGFRSQAALPLSKPPTLFKTAAETFYDSRSGSNGPYDQHWVESARDQPKVREDAHPVPGGGWARGRNLIPRTATSIHSKSLLPNGQTECAASDPVKSTAASAAQAQPDKENTPPMKSGRGLKRTLSIVGEARDREDVPHKTNDKKRKQNSAPAVSNNEPGGAKRTAVGLTARDKTNMSGASSPPVAASSPSRITASVTRSLPVMAMSEPDYLTPRPPIVATSMLPALTTEPQTPPRHETPSNRKTDDSLFTPCAPDDEMTSLFRGNTHHSANELLSSPSVNRKKFHAAHVGSKMSVLEGGQQCPRTAPELRPIKTGWDLPPSSPPPPTSPISPRAEIVSEQDDNMDFESIIQLQTGPIEMERGAIDGRFGDWGTTIKSAVASTPVADAFQLPDSSDFDMLTDADFDLGLLSQSQESTEEVGVELDIEELWNSLGPVIAQAQSDSSVPVNSQTSSSQVEADFSYFDLENDQTRIETGGVLQNGVDAAKLAEDLKALFGGCVV